MVTVVMGDALQSTIVTIGVKSVVAGVLFELLILFAAAPPLISSFVGLFSSSVLFLLLVSIEVEDTSPGVVLVGVTAKLFPGL